MNNAEYGGIRSNAKRHDEDCRACKCWTFQQHSYRKFQISHERSHSAPPSMKRYEQFSGQLHGAKSHLISISLHGNRKNACPLFNTGVQ
jgi:hypothetical protein